MYYRITFDMENIHGVVEHKDTTAGDDLHLAKDLARKYSQLVGVTNVHLWKDPTGYGLELAEIDDTTIEESYSGFCDKWFC